MSNDLKFRPEKALEEIKQTLALVRNQSLARMYIVSNPQDCDALLPQITALINQLDQKKPTFAQYSVQPTILTRMKSRYPGLEKPIYAGLVNADSRNGVFLFSAPCADLKTTDEKSLLDFVAAQLYSGGGNHSMLMKTWGAGLAYSNGFGVNELNGRLSYYAERCPDLSATMRFVVNELENIPFDTSLAEYAVAQLFSAGRTANSYQSRGASMAANLADGVTPEMVSNFRRQMLNLRQKKNFYELLHNRLPQVYGQVLIGYGPPLAKVNEGIYFIIGPEEQFASLKKYIAETEGEQEIYKIYPRDYWLVH